MTVVTEKLIEEAAKVVHSEHKNLLNLRDSERVARTALAVFEKAHTPTDDEREALTHLIGYELYAEQMAKAVGGRPDRSGFDSLGVVFKDTWLDLTRPIADAILAAGFRRSVEPSTEHRCEDCPTCGVHGDSHLKCCGCYDGVCCQESAQDDLGDWDSVHDRPATIYTPPEDRIRRSAVTEQGD